MTLQLPDGSPIYDSSNTSTPNGNVRKVGGISGIIGVILLYLIGNVVFVGAQKIWHSGDQNKFDNIKQELTTKKTEIDDLESKINTKKSEMDRNSANGYIDAYNSEVNDYNLMLDKYDSDVDSYNKLVTEANGLSKKIGGTWYIVPIPVGRTK